MYHFTVTAHELPEPFVKTIDVQTLPFDYRQDQMNP